MSESTPKSNQDVTNEYWLALLLWLYPFDFGSCWWVKEQVWQEFALLYDENSTRDGHPAICIRNGRPLEDLNSPVSLLHGSTSTRTGFRVSGLGPDPSVVSFFGHLYTTLVPLNTFREKDDSGQLIRRNPYKPHLTETEGHKLQTFLEQTGIYE